MDKLSEAVQRAKLKARERIIAKHGATPRVLKAIEEVGREYSI